MEKRTIIIIAVVAVVLLCLCLGAIGAAVTIFGGAGLQGISSLVGDFTDLQAAGDQFLGYLEDGDHRQAFQMMHPDLQAEVGSPVQFARQLEDAIFSVQSWSNSSQSVENEYGTLEGTIDDVDGEAWSYYLEFVRENDRWLLIEYNFDYQG